MFKKLEDCRILEIAPFYPPRPGGQERYVKTLSENLSLRCAQVRTSYSIGYKECQIPIKKTSKHELGRYVRIATILGNPISPRMIMDSSNGEDFDIVHFHNLYSCSSIAAISTSNKMRKKPMIVATNHGRLEIESDSIRGILNKKYELKYFPWVLDKCDLVVCLSDYEKDYLRKFSSHPKIVVIRPGIDSDRIIKVYPDIQTNIDRRIPFSQSNIRLLYVGGLNKRKGIDILLNQISQISKCDRTIHLDIIGSGPMSSIVKYYIKYNKLEDIINLNEDATDQIVFKSMMESDILVIPSRSEGYPAVAVEAKILSLPIISSSIPPLRSVLGDSAEYFEISDQNGLQKAVESLRKKYIWNEEKECVARNSAIRLHNWDRIIEEYVNAFQTLFN